LWLDREAKEAAEFYTSVFPDSGIISIATIRNTPSGDSDIVSFRICGFEMMAISAGPLFKINPSISLMVNFDPAQDPNAAQRIDTTWNKLAEGGKVLIPLDQYPFSKRYGWVQDKYGFTWQLILTDPDDEIRPMVIPSLLFVGDVCGKAEEASDFYIRMFQNSRRGAVAYYPAGMEPDKEGTVMFTDFQLEGQWFAAMDSAKEHDFKFNEAVSLIVQCDDQAEIDAYWKKLSASPKHEQCGWLKDKYGVSWQISFRELDEMLATGTREQVDRVTQTFLPMKKLDVKKIRAAFEGAVSNA
jgi:predicted 3-demethylubiquinone-9 3-methyltransferase (glyoxalase superfamily)